VGLGATLLAVALFSWYTLQQIQGLRRLQTQIVDASRKDTLQLLRIQNNLHSLALSMRDMVEGAEPYPLEAWKSEFDRTRYDLNDALEIERQLSPASRTPEQQEYLAASLGEFWQAVDGMFALAESGDEAAAKERIQTILQARHASVTATVSRFLVMNNEAEEQAVGEIQQIYAGVERNIYYFLAGIVLAISATSLYLILQNRRIFQNLAQLSDQRQVLARKLITVQEDVFHSVARELHDEFGQVLTAVGIMLQRTEKQSADSPLRQGLSEIRPIVQKTLEKVRSLSHQLHPNILDDYGLEKALEWYVREFQQQTGLAINYEKEGAGPPISSDVAIHVYRILQEALNNVVRHANSPAAWVRLRVAPNRLHMEVEDRGSGFDAASSKHGLGLVAMRERSELLHGSLVLRRGAEGGTLVQLDIPLGDASPS
jgi:signal transduction histidine kinase